MALGLVAFIFDTAGGVLVAKLINLFLPKEKKLNPMIGACGISAFPMSARVVYKMAIKEGPAELSAHAVRGCQRIRAGRIRHRRRSAAESFSVRKDYEL